MHAPARLSTDICMGDRESEMSVRCRAGCRDLISRSHKHPQDAGFVEKAEGWREK